MTPVVPPAKRRWPAVAAHLAILAGVLIVLWVCQRQGWDPFATGVRSRAGRMIQLALVLGVIVVGCAFAARRVDDPLATLAALFARAPRAIAYGLTIFVLVACTTIASTVLLVTPPSGDEIAYLFQGEMLANGRLWVPAPAAWEYLKAFFLFNFEGRIVGQYPPGWPAVLAVVTTMSVPTWLINPILSALTVLALYRLGARDFGAGQASLTCVLLCTGGFVLFNGASLFNHGIVMLLGIVLVLAAQDFDRTGAWRSAAVAGLTFSAIAVTRHYDAILFAMPIAIIALRRWRAWLRAIVPGAVAALPLIALLLAYYDVVSGSPLQTPMTLAHPWDRLLGPNFSVTGATTLLIGRIAEFAEWLSPAFVALWVWALLHRLRRGELRFYEYYPLIFLAGYWLYWGAGGSRWGPRYIQPAFPFMALTIAAATWPMVVQSASRGQRFVAHLLITTVTAGAAQLAFLTPGAHRIAEETLAPYRQIEAGVSAPAVVIFTHAPGSIWQLSPGNLTRNTIGFDAPVVFAHTGDLFTFDPSPEAVSRAAAELSRHYPDRQIWVYEPDPGRPLGRLARIDPLPQPSRSEPATPQSSSSGTPRP